MKKNYLLFIVLVTTLANAQYFEDFEKGVPGTMTQKFQKEETSWIDFGLSAIYVENAISGDNSAVFFNGVSASEVATTLETPILDLTSPKARLEFKHLQKERNVGYSNKLSVELSNDAGKTWTVIKNCSETNENIIKEHIDLAFFKPSKNAIIRFTAIQPKIDKGYPIVLDDVDIAFDSDCYNNTVAKGIADTEFTVYPNPSHGKFKIKTTNPVDITISDFNGTIVRTMYQVSNQTQVDLSSLTKGIYFVKTINKNSEKTQKIILY